MSVKATGIGPWLSRVAGRVIVPSFVPLVPPSYTVILEEATGVLTVNPCKIPGELFTVVVVAVVMFVDFQPAAVWLPSCCSAPVIMLLL